MSALAHRIVEESTAAGFAGPAGARRRAAAAALGSVGLPTSRDENWKYASLRPLERQNFTPAPRGVTITAAVLPAPITGFARYVFVDGHFAPALSAAPGAGFAALAAAETPPAAAAAVGGDARFALLNAAFAQDGAQLKLGRGENARAEVVFVAASEAAVGASYPRLEIELAEGAQLELIERHLGAGEVAAFVNSALTVQLDRGAQLRHTRLQDLPARALSFDTLSAELHDGSAYRLLGVATGAQSARSTLLARLAGEGAGIDMALAALGEAAQVQDAYARIEHVARNTRTEQLFRGIAADRARVAFNGKVVVDAGAAGTDSRQSLRGLLAGSQAEIDVRPQLEIYTDDVRCSHGATAGKLDDAMLFYLLSRGLEPATAQRLLKWAFLADAFARIEIPDLRRQIEARLAGALHDGALKELL
ncbi:MAG: SufD family Fe-S cluster assembly protein [Proteobacteria bacterium]|nr:SufD family Fe-S cluster assembly protein [Pseudomonadota bacterium]